tara:strand:+ start:554 stop:1141 length:588 start_codon:yes stop_codon:yes gene_type:complete
MASKVEICNSALNMLGANNITDITEDSKNARLLNQRYDPIRDAVFRLHAWNCLIKRVELAQDSDTPTHEFAKQYTLPADCLRVLKIGGHHDGSSSDLDDGQQFKIEGRKLLTDEATVYLIYIAKITDVNQYDTLLQETIAARLASELCYAITSSTSLATQMNELYKEKLREARHIDASEGTAEMLDSSTFINSRF